MMLYEKYLDSSDFHNLCVALDFLPEDIEEIKQKINDLDDKTNLEESIALVIYGQMLNYKDNPTKDISFSDRYFRWLSGDSSFSRNEYFCQIFIKDQEKWGDIRNKMAAGIHSGKINSDYLFEKEYQRELNSISTSVVEDAFNAIYLHEINYLVGKFRIHEDYVREVFTHACLEGYYANPLCFNEVEKVFEESLKIIFKKPLKKIEDFDYIYLLNAFTIVEDEKLAPLIDQIFRKCDKNYLDGFTDYLLLHSPYSGDESVFYVVACGTSEGFKPRSDFSNVICIKKDLIKNSKAVHVNKDSDLINHFENFVLDDFSAVYSKLGKGKTRIFDDFKVETIENQANGKSWHIFDVLENDYDPNDLFEIASQKPLCDEFLGLISSLDLTVDDALEIQNGAQNTADVMRMLYKKISKNNSQDVLSKEELLKQLNRLYLKAILLFRYNDWDEINGDLTGKIDSGEIKSAYDLHAAFDSIVKSDFRVHLLYAQIIALIDFKEIDFKYGEKLAFYLLDKDILDNGLSQYLNEISIPKKRQKEYVDEGKFSAPRWLVYPELDAYTIGWRMGYGETYCLNQPFPGPEFGKLFPTPQNWLFDPRDGNIDGFPLLGYFWTPGGKPKYSEVSEDSIAVNEFITVDQIDSKFQYNAFHLKSIENGVLLAKYSLFRKIDPYNVSLNTLKRGFELSDEEIEHWQKFRYSVLLNAAYYKFMQDEDLKVKLLSTGNKSLVYVSDDEWGGDENLFGFALMELRDEIRRLYENEDLIDWEYTEYLKHKNPYENPVKRDPHDKQSPEYMVIDSTLRSASRYARDINLSDDLARRYEAGQIITERAFVDASSKIGGMVTSHRYLILSQYFVDFSEFEQGTNWSLHTAKNGSKFKVLDVFTVGDKTQILLLQLPEGFEEVFKTKVDIEERIIERERENFKDDLESAVFEELTTDEWLERCSFPLGMNDEGEFF